MAYGLKASSCDPLIGTMFYDLNMLILFIYNMNT